MQKLRLWEWEYKRRGVEGLEAHTTIQSSFSTHPCRIKCEPPPGAEHLHAKSKLRLISGEPTAHCNPNTMLPLLCTTSKPNTMERHTADQVHLRPGA